MVSYSDLYIGLDGKPVKRTPKKHPYSYDPYVLWKGDFGKGKSYSVYADKLMQDYEKYKKCCNDTWGKDIAYFRGDSKFVEKFLSLYLEKEIKLTAIVEGCNHLDGIPYWVLFYEIIEV